MLKFMGPLVVVDDIATSRRFYEETLGLKVTMDFGVNISFEGNVAIHLKSHYQDLLGSPEQFPIARMSNNFELYFETDDVDACCQRLEQAGARFVHKIVVQPWEQRVVRVYDPDGYIIEIGETMESLTRRLHSQGDSVETISKKTGLPAPYIEQLIA